jgi:probable HAF family extracellular repeat protein
MTRRHLVHTFLIAGLLSWGAIQSDAQQYNLTSLGVGSPATVYYNYTTPKINNKGQVVGNGSGGGYLFSGGVLTSLPGFNALDNNGALALYSFSTSDSYISFPPYSTRTDLGTLPPCFGVYGDNFATSLNDSGAVVGVSNAPTKCAQPFFFFNGQMAAMGQSARGWVTLNNLNQVIGYFPGSWLGSTAASRAVQLINGTFTDLDPSNASAYDSQAIAINDAGQFTVNSNEAYCTTRLGPPSFKTITYVCRGAYFYPFLYSSSTITALGTLGPYGGTAAGVNKWGDVVGASQTSTGASHAFLYSAGTTIDLNSHLTTTGLGWTIQQAYDINDSGQIVALATDFKGNPDVVLLSPAVGTMPFLVSLTLNPTSVLGGISGSNTSTGTVTLSSTAPAGGVIVSLSSSSPVAQVPSTIRVPAGSTTATFTVTTTTLLVTTNVTISATAGTSTRTATLTVIDVGS